MGKGYHGARFGTGILIWYKRNIREVLALGTIGKKVCRDTLSLPLWKGWV